MSTRSLTLPLAPGDTVTRAVSGITIEELTGVVGNTLTLSGDAVFGLVFKNGSAMTNASATVSGTSVTVSVASIAGDQWVVWYWTRS